jgi:protein gp37
MVARLSAALDWVVVGGESGGHRRDCGVEAIISVVEQCTAAGVPVYVKQDCGQTNALHVFDRKTIGVF